MKQSNVNVPQLSDSLQNVITQKEVLKNTPRKYQQCIAEGDNFVRKLQLPSPPVAEIQLQKSMQCQTVVS